MKQEMNGSRIFALFAASVALSAGIGCTQSAQDKGGLTAQNFVQAGDPNLVRTIGDAQHSFTVLGHDAFKAQLATGEIAHPSSTRATDALGSVIEARRARGRGGRSAAPPVVTDPVNTVDTSPTSLVFGLPFKLLKQPMAFGSVITQVSDQNDQNLGDLKLADIPTFQVTLTAHKLDAQTYVVSVVDCGADCANPPSQDSLIDIPVTGVDTTKKLVYLDLATLGKGLDLTAIRKGDPSLAKFASKSSQTVKFDYSNGTLVFDVEAHLIDVNASPTDNTAKETVITNRWFFTPETPFNPSFTTRKATPGVGFFMTEKSTDPLVNRWDFDLRGDNDGIKYYLKHVPQEYQAAFAGCFDEWNSKLLPVVGKKIFSYEFIPEGDSRNDLLVTGDVRYNVVEWDLLNKASYGGLGPSLANQYSGEIFHANVLIQGPTIVDLYTKWFNANQTANGLVASGRSSEANVLLAKTTRELNEKIAAVSSRSFQMNFGKSLKLRIRSQEPALEDPLMAKDGFDPVPSGYTYDTYMSGYFHDMLTHELGHNLGLRHNFRGSLGAVSSEGKVSRSVMEYLGRGYRQLDHVGEYDLMALSYGYAGIQPQHTDWFCTDEDAADLNDASKSAECTPNDATDDPFSFYQAELSRAFDLLLARGQTSTSPDWVVDDMADQLKNVFVGLGAYAVSAVQTSASWTNFFNKLDRPTQASDVKGYVLQKIKSSLCDSSLDSEVGAKASADSKTKAQANLDAVRAKAVELLKPVFSPTDLKCVGVNGLI